MSFEPACNKPRYARVALVGPPTGNCEAFALEIATGITGSGRIAVIDTGHTLDALIESYSFDAASISVNPKAVLIREEALSAAKDGYDCLVVAGLTPSWLHVRGEIDRHKNIKNLESNVAWFKGREAYRAMIADLQAWPGHVIVTAQTLVEYRVDESGPSPVGRPVSLAPLDDGNLYRDWAIVGRTDFDGTVSFELSAYTNLLGKRLNIEELGAVLPELCEWLGVVDSGASK